ncbi:conserved protein of unknown function [Burkholderia multivorans]
MSFRLLSKFKRHFARAQPFSIEQFIGDCRDNMRHVTSSKKLRRCWGVEFKPMVLDREEVNAGVARLDQGQFLIYLNIGLLKACYKFLLDPVCSYYERHEDALDVDAHLFARMCLGACGLMAFWHEFAHAVRGHVEYKNVSGQLTDAGISEASDRHRDLGESATEGWIPWRIVELDADIFGAQFLLAQMAVVMSGNSNISVATFAQCYAIGIRGLFHVLNGIGGVHDDATGSTHPNSISRAYAAFAHGLARLSEVQLSSAIQEKVSAAGYAALLDFEVNDLKMIVDPTVLARFSETEIDLWREREQELIQYELPRHDTPEHTPFNKLTDGV